MHRSTFGDSLTGFAGTTGAGTPRREAVSHVIILYDLIGAGTDYDSSVLR
jgi:hypothetical protein